jgi:hypothetical protein
MRKHFHGDWSQIPVKRTKAKLTVWLHTPIPTIYAIIVWFSFLAVRVAIVRTCFQFPYRTNSRRVKHGGYCRKKWIIRHFQYEHMNVKTEWVEGSETRNKISTTGLYTYYSVRPRIAGGRGMAQAVSRRPLAGEAHVGFVMDMVALGQVFLRVWFYALNIIPPWLSMLIYLLYIKANVCVCVCVCLSVCSRLTL